jgi:hypothetical protein
MRQRFFCNAAITGRLPPSRASRADGGRETFKDDEHSGKRADRDKGASVCQNMFNCRTHYGSEFLFKPRMTLEPGLIARRRMR